MSGAEVAKIAAERERAAVVAWLDEMASNQAKLGFNPAIGKTLGWAKRLIERGEHLKENQHG